MKHYLRNRIKQLQPSNAYDTNCIGTALFLLDVNPHDKDVDCQNSEEIEALVENSFDEVKTPQLGDLVIFKGICYGFPDIDHMGVFLGAERMIHRRNGDGPVEEVNPEAFRLQEHPETTVEFHRPKVYA